MTQLKLTEPTLLLDKSKCLENIHRMIDKAEKQGVIFRPHFKTHQSTEIGGWFREKGVDRITVSSVKMAQYFAEDGWTDITIAFPYHIHQTEAINQFAQHIQINLLIINIESINYLEEKLKRHVHFFIEIDPEYHRSGIHPDDKNTILEILNRAKKHPELFTFMGFIEHAGQTYKLKGKAELIKQINLKCQERAKMLKKAFSTDFPEMIYSSGDTPSFSICNDFQNIDELRPGNAVFYDVDQYEIGSCTLDQIAVAVACPVVAVYPERNELVVHGGSVHLSKDSSVLPDGKSYFGLAANLNPEGWEFIDGAYVSMLSQEHGVIKFPDSKTLSKFKPGDFICIVPIHACLTCDAMPFYLTTEGRKIEKLNRK